MGDKKEIIRLCAQKGFLLDKEVLDILLLFNNDFISDIINIFFNITLKDKLITKNIIIENKEIFYKNIKYQNEFDRLIKKFDDKKTVDTINSRIKILSSLNFDSKKIEVDDFISYFKSRYEQLKFVLENKNINNLRSLRRISRDGEKQNIIVMIKDKKITKNNNIMFFVEDLTGEARFLINANKENVFEKCKNILLDEVVCFNVCGNKDIFFIEDVVFPDISLKNKKFSSDNVSVAFISDIHVGSKMFLEDNFLNFINWINGEIGNDEDKKIAKNIKYLFINGDNIDGVGVFPEQEQFLSINTVSDQYNKLTEYLKKIRGDIEIIISPGQHDAVWVGEPQRPIPQKWISELYNMKNVNIVSNPSLVEIEGQFKILMYHGASLHGVVNQIPEIRISYGHNSPTKVLKQILEARHLAPTHGECDYVPNKEDILLIKDVPDIVTTADWHRAETSEYNNILLISSSCWQSKTPFEEKVGNNPDPCKVPVLNLKTMEVRVVDFSKKQNGSE